MSNLGHHLGDTKQLIRLLAHGKSKVYSHFQGPLLLVLGWNY